MEDKKNKENKGYQESVRRSNDYQRRIENMVLTKEEEAFLEKELTLGMKNAKENYGEPMNDNELTIIRNSIKSGILVSLLKKRESSQENL